MSAASLLALIVVVVPPLVVSRRLGRRVVPLVAANYFAFLVLSALLYGVLPYGVVKLAVTAGGALVLGRVMVRAVPEDDSWPVLGRRALALLFGLGAASVVVDAFIFSRQGFSLATRTSLFAAAFVGDIQRDTDMISGLLRGSQSVFFPRSHFVYQVLWHHGAANVIGVLPDHFTLFPYVLGVALTTGLLFYVMLYWVALVVRPALLTSPVALGLVVAFAASDADLYNAFFSWIQDGRVALAADASTRIESVFRYFSNKLVTLSAPQHGTFFILFSVVIALTYEPPVGEWARPAWQRPRRWAVTVFGAACVVANPVLTVLILPIYWAILAVRWWVLGRDAREIIACALLSGLAGAVLHVAILRFSPIDLFTRPHVTGGGSGVYGVHVLWTLPDVVGFLRRVPGVFVAVSGVIGAVVTGVLGWATLCRRRLLADSLLLALVIGTVVWEVLVIETEIQRHFAMVAAFLGVLVIAGIVPAPRLFSGPLLLFVPPAALALVLNGYLTMAYATGGHVLDPSVPWPDYYCVNEAIRAGYSDLPVVVRTPDAFELPIAAEATSALVWSQVAAVHQKVSKSQARMMDELNSRDREAFRRAVLRDPEGTLVKLRHLGYEAVIWGPVEEREWGPSVRQALVKPEAFLHSCGLVGLYALVPGQVGRDAPGSAVAAHGEFLRRLLGQKETLCSSGPGPDVNVVLASSPRPAGRTNWARGRSARASSTIRRTDPHYAVDGDTGAESPLAHTAHELSAWWEVDLGASRPIDAVQIWNRLDCCQDWLRAFYVLVADVPFRTSGLYRACTQPGVSTYFVPGEASAAIVVPVNRSGRYVRIQLLRPGPLALREVEVWGGQVQAAGRARQR